MASDTARHRAGFLLTTTAVVLIYSTFCMRSEPILRKTAMKGLRVGRETIFMGPEARWCGRKPAVRVHGEPKPPMRFDPRRNSIIPPEQNIVSPKVSGRQTKNYRWEQSASDIFVFLPVNDTVKGKDINIKAKPSQLVVKNKDEILFNATLAHEIRSYDLQWSFEEVIEGKKELLVMIQKDRPLLIWDDLVLGESYSAHVTITDVVFFDFEIRKFVEIDGKTVKKRKKLGKVCIGLFGLVEPQLVQKFVEVAYSDVYSYRLNGTLSYKDSIIHRIQKGSHMLGGAVVNPFKGIGEDLIGPNEFDGQMPIKGPGQVAVELDSSGSPVTSYVITTGVDGIDKTAFYRQPVVIGKVIAGFHTILEMEELGSPDEEGRPKFEFGIYECGILNPKEFNTKGIVPYGMQGSKYSPRRRTPEEEDAKQGAHYPPQRYSSPLSDPEAGIPARNPARNPGREGEARGEEDEASD
ncbi:hypothetical protein AAMO2058_001069000 [Amorphochlora amoebiformis]|mmetsp:Transcript_27238/g.43234  ORF Transcript_27238/g.43234 Transcript_27238/m.43234 type:complete len:465 (-) Transcript_27238:2-1396(-)